MNSMNCTPYTLRHHAPGGLSPLAVSTVQRAARVLVAMLLLPAGMDAGTAWAGWLPKRHSGAPSRREGASRGDGEPRAAGERATKGRYRTQCRLLCVVAECELRRRLTISGPVAPSAE